MAKKTKKHGFKYRLIKWGLIGLLLFLFFQYFWVLDSVWRQFYDIVSLQSEPKTRIDIKKSVLSLKSFTYEQVKDDVWIRKSGIADKDYKTIYERKIFLKVGFWTRYKFVVRNFRFMDFIPHDNTFNKYNFAALWKHEYLVIDRMLLYKLNDLMIELDRNGYAPQAITVTSGFRTPKQNELVGGASQSRHMHGDAVDISIEDVTNNGKRNQKDVSLIYEILNTKIVRNSGGVGRYQHSPFLIHLDTRDLRPGHSARW